MTTKGKVKSAFAPYDPYFSFEKFEGQIISLIRMAIMSDHPENLASYCGGTLNPYFQDIIEMTYMQAMTVQDIHMEGSVYDTQDMVDKLQREGWQYQQARRLYRRYTSEKYCLHGTTWILHYICSLS